MGLVGSGPDTETREDEIGVRGGTADIGLGATLGGDRASVTAWDVNRPTLI